jgi:hypothetical protein
MMNEKMIKVFYVLAGLYDGILGIAFLLSPAAIYAMYAVEPPNHMAYLCRHVFSDSAGPGQEPGPDSVWLRAESILLLDGVLVPGNLDDTGDVGSMGLG